MLSADLYRGIIYDFYDVPGCTGMVMLIFSGLGLVISNL